MRGLKSNNGITNDEFTEVALSMGAWIEIDRDCRYHGIVASHSLWVRGLKYNCVYRLFTTVNVALSMGAWIEIASDFLTSGTNIKFTKQS